MTEQEKAPIASTNKTEWRAVVQIVTIARFRRPANPRRCNVHRYHVWRWKALVNDPNTQPMSGMACECGCLTWTERKERPMGSPEEAP